jgi:hypothetical protein
MGDLNFATLRSALIPLAFISLLAGCGKENLASRPLDPAFKSASTTNGSATVPLATPSSPCGLFFSKENLCASIVWRNGPTVTGTSDYGIFFWDASTGSSAGPYIEPAAKVLSFPRMHCCKRVVATHMSKQAAGEYTVTGAILTPGDWEMTIQLQYADSKESVFEMVTLE